MKSLLVKPIIKKILGFCINSKSNWAPVIKLDKEYLELPSWSELEDYFN